MTCMCSFVFCLFHLVSQENGVHVVRCSLHLRKHAYPIMETRVLSFSRIHVFSAYFLLVFSTSSCSVLSFLLGLHTRAQLASVWAENHACLDLVNARSAWDMSLCAAGLKINYAQCGVVLLWKDLSKFGSVLLEFVVVRCQLAKKNCSRISSMSTYVYTNRCCFLFARVTHANPGIFSVGAVLSYSVLLVFPSKRVLLRIWCCFPCEVDVRVLLAS
jgi:phage tail protein X